ncbi:MAG: geranylgeranyl reductase family protein [Burkholderiaceae bacterium]|nr:geranylgeranyl reductase family protein [Roseateles sp.]MBV8468949.1 geranylgeranyl reductase family protein [Burkholderiaceae bacterium]
MPSLSSLSRTDFSCHTLVIGAGPAGSAAARMLAQAGVDVLLVDQQPMGRDKVCGDGLVPDTHHALRRLGLLDQVLAQARPVTHIGCIGPRGGRVDVPGELAVLPRKALDEILARGAVDAGARFLAPCRFEGVLEDASGRVTGARFKHGDQSVEIRASWVLLATGANPKPLQLAGVCERHTPSGVALRGYVHAPALVEQMPMMDMVWSRAVRPGYGWIFPAPGACFNVGVIVADSHRTLSSGKGAKKDLNLRAIFDAFCKHYPPAATLMREGRLTGELKGAPMRFTLNGARWSRSGLMVIGEAAGTTYSFTGEGIGKAMETGMLAAEALIASRGAAPQGDAQVREHYEQGLRKLQPRYRLYERANRVNALPWLADLVVWRAQRSQSVLSRLSGVLNETSNPGNPFSLKGMKRLFLD